MKSQVMFRLSRANKLALEEGDNGTARLYQLKCIRTLAKRHQAIAVMECNGFGKLNGKTYYNGAIDDYARRTYGPNVRSAYITIETDGYIDNTDQTVWSKASDKLESAIEELARVCGMTVEFQGDPRGATVIVKSHTGRTLDLCL